jgi:ATP-binding cassette subfamily F protein uup
MGLIWINEVSVSFGGPRLLDGVTLQIEAGERIGLLGRNGSGKSTLMKLLMGDITPDTGGIIRSGEVRIAMLPQNIPDDLPGTVYCEFGCEFGGANSGDMILNYRRLREQYYKFPYVSAPRRCMKDEGRPLGAGLQEQASNHLKLHW